MLLALAFAAVMNFVSYFFSDKIALAMYRAQPVTREELPRAYNIVERLTQKIGIPMPKLYVIPIRVSQCFCHRAKSAACIGSRDSRNSEFAHR